MLNRLGRTLVCLAKRRICSLPGNTPHQFCWHNMLHLFVPATTATRCISFCLPPQEDPSAGRKVPPPYSIKTEQAFTTTGVCWFVVWPYFPV